MSDSLALDHTTQPFTLPRPILHQIDEKRLGKYGYYRLWIELSLIFSCIDQTLDIRTKYTEISSISHPMFNVGNEEFAIAANQKANDGSAMNESTDFDRNVS